MNQHALLQVNELSHTYDKFQVLEPLTFELQAGEIAALYGANGSGKTTLLMCLGGLLRPTNGEVLVNGSSLYSDERAVHRDLAFVPDVPRFYMELTAWEHLLFIASAHDAMQGFQKRAETLLNEFGLWEARNLHPHHFSRGMSLKLGLVLALIRPFKVLLLDEPTSALDSESAQGLIERLLDLRQGGTAILLSTHNSEHASKLADHLYHLENGKLNTD